MVRRRRSMPWLLLAAIFAAGCAGDGERADTVTEPIEGPRIRVLGTVQDGGLPHAACTCERCEAARVDPTRRRHVASLAILLPDSGKVFLIDATPDLREQLMQVRDLGEHPDGRVDRAPVDGVLLTHAHIGHYTGLAFFGFEAVHTSDLPVHCTARMAEFLSSNGPWDQLVRLGNIRPLPFEPGRAVPLGDGVEVTPLLVPHRDEYADTVGFVIAGPRSRVLYVPDTAPWEQWERPLTEVLDGIDVALLDGAFYSMDELPGRDVGSTGHPLVVSTMDLLQSRVDRGGLRVLLTHLNHSNPALDPDSPERAEMRERGFEVLAEGLDLPL
jgi:pyrroloquinoline quinone biosynthesis protein B